MIRTLKRTATDITCSPDILGHDSVEQIITDLTDQMCTNIKLIGDNTEYISGLICRVIDVVSLFEAVNIVNDEFLNDIPGCRDQIWGRVSIDYRYVVLRFNEFYSWLQTDVLLLTPTEIETNGQFTLDEIALIKQIVKDQSTLLVIKLDRKRSEILNFIRTNIDKNDTQLVYKSHHLEVLSGHIGNLIELCNFGVRL